MMPVLKFLNDNHWYIIAGCLLCIVLFWAYGCESTVSSLIDETKKVNRAELQNELQYLIGRANAQTEKLDKQDEIKQALLDSVNVIGQGGQINPSGLLNLVASIGGVSFGLSQRQKLKTATVKKTTDIT